MARILTMMAVTGIGVLLSSCGWLFGDDGVFRDRGDDYLKAKEYPRTEVPQDLDSASIDDLYVVPPSRRGTGPTPEAFEVPRPEPLVGAADANSVRIQKLGNQQWILVYSTPGQVWPRVTGFLLGNRIQLDVEDGVNGVAETAWLMLENAPNKKEKYRFRVDRGVQRETAEIFVTQIEMPASADSAGSDHLDWPRYSHSFERESWMVRELATYFANNPGRQSYSLLAQGISAASKVKMHKGEQGWPFIALQLPYDRAWASLGRALEKAHFEVKDLDRSEGIYFVLHRPKAEEEEDKPGFFARLFGGDDEEGEAGDGDAFRVNIASADAGVHISIRSESAEEALSVADAESLLRQIQGNLF